ncbi:MAG: (2Fe-2S)-binding protein [Desulfobacteraceae bacterium]|nr:(2Fe-2S)-binding protein [Desulfobacteraceae bacterium]
MKQTIDLNVNGQTYEVETQPWRTLAEVLRDQLNLTGTKISCAEGHCGACTVIINGRAVNSCLMLIAEAQGKEILTIEGLSGDGELHPIQDAFVTHGAVQCGFCTPGLIMGAKSFLADYPDPSEEEIKKALSGHLCRCTGYVQIIEAVKAAAVNMKSSSSERR